MKVTLPSEPMYVFEGQGSSEHWLGVPELTGVPAESLTVPHAHLSWEEIEAKPMWPYWKNEKMPEVWHFGEKRRTGLFLDTGAAENLTGDKAMIHHMGSVVEPPGK